MSFFEEARSFLQKLIQNPPVLPLEPTLLPMLFSVTDEGSKASSREVVALVERSQTLATRVLVLANSVVYGLRYKVTNLHQAVSILGMEEIRLLTVIVGVSSFVNDIKLPSGFNATGIWKHQLKVATISKVLAEQIKMATLSNMPAEQAGPDSSLHGPSANEQEILCLIPQDSYVIGLLHDIGQFCFVARRPDLWEMADTLRVKEGLRFADAENKFWGMDHALIGATVLHNWNLPSTVTTPIHWHHAPDLATQHTVETRLLAAANQIAHDGLAEGNCVPDEVMPLLPEKSDPHTLGAAIAAKLVEEHSETFAMLVR